MTLLLNAFLGLVIILIQATLFPVILLFQRHYDLVLPVVVYLGLYRSFKESFLLLAGLGLVMDSLSGGAFGLYLTTYFWLYAGVKWTIRLLDRRNPLLTVGLIGLGVLVENGLFLAVTFSKFSMPISAGNLNGIFIQLVWAIVTGPLMVLFLASINRRWEHFGSRLAAERNGYGKH